jgi:hypothetical protein
MKLHLKNSDIDAFRALKREKGDSWRFTFRVFKRMNLRAQSYEEAKRDILLASVRRADQLQRCYARRLDILQDGFSEIKEKDLDMINQVNFSDLVSTPVDVSSYDGRTTDFYDIFINCVRTGYDCVDFGTENEVFYYYDGISIKNRKYSQGPVDYHENISRWIQSSRPCSKRVFENFCSTYNVEFNEEFLQNLDKVTPLKKILAYDYREDVEIYLQIVEKGFSARNVDYEGEAFYFLANEDGDCHFARLTRDDDDYEQSVFLILSSAIPMGKKNLELFVDNFDLEFEPFIDVYNYITGLSGGGPCLVGFFPNSFEVFYSGNLDSGQLMSFYVREFLGLKIMRESIAKSDSFYISNLEYKVKSLQFELVSFNPNVEMSMSYRNQVESFVSLMMSTQALCWRNVDSTFVRFQNNSDVGVEYSIRLVCDITRGLPFGLPRVVPSGRKKVRRGHKKY